MNWLVVHRLAHHPFDLLTDVFLEIVPGYWWINEGELICIENRSSIQTFCKKWTEVIYYMCCFIKETSSNKIVMASVY